MKAARFIFPFLLLLLSLPAAGTVEVGEAISNYAEQYAKCENAPRRLQLANDFFAYLLQTDYIDEPIAFPADSHIDSVDVNVYYYVAEWYYGEGEYQSAVDYCTRATGCFGVVDDASKSDVYALLGAAYFRQSAYDKAVEVLNKCYVLDKKSGDFDRISSTLNSIASVFVAAGEPQEAEKYIKEAIAANSLTNNLSRRAVLYGTASELYRSMDDAGQSLEYARKAIDTARQVGDSARIGIRLSQLANAQLANSKVNEARQSLEEAIPLLHRSGNLHSWGICQNQMGDILASEDKYEEAAACYLDAAMLFLRQGDKYNELHAREGLYKVTKASAPNEAMMHLERTNLLRDSIYQHETGEALGKYNAIYYNDILQKEKERAEHRHRTILITAIVSSVLLLALIGIGVVFLSRRHKRKEKDYEQSISTLQDENSEINRQYENMVAEMLRSTENLTDDDRRFLSRLTSAISEETEKGVTDIKAIALHINISSSALHRRLAKALSVTPKTFILRVRMNKAKYLLQNYRDITVANVAFKCGYSQIGNFTRAFTRHYGITPTEMRGKKE